MSHRIEFILFSVFKWVVLLLPLKSAQRLGYYLGWGAYYLIGERRRVALENLGHAFPEKSEQERIAIAKGSFRNFAISFVELIWFPNLTPTRLEQLVKFDEIAILNEVDNAQKGFILLTAHFGNWELTALATGNILHKPVTMIVQTQNNLLVDEVINRHRCLLGNRVVPMGMSVREILRTLEHHGIVGIAADQSAAKESIQIEFFGRKVATHEGPAVFALRTGAPILMEFAVREPDFTYRIALETVSVADLPEEKEARVIELTRRHTTLLERYIRKYPDQWLWIHRRWKHTEETSRND